MPTTVEVEYCGKCGYLNKFMELSEYITKQNPDVNIVGREGRRASFEVMVNGTLVHSKLSTLALPDYSDLSAIIRDATEEKNIRTCKQQPITDCSVT